MPRHYHNAKRNDATLEALHAASEQRSTHTARNPPSAHFPNKVPERPQPAALLGRVGDVNRFRHYQLQVVPLHLESLCAGYAGLKGQEVLSRDLRGFG